MCLTGALAKAQWRNTVLSKKATAITFPTTIAIVNWLLPKLGQWLIRSSVQWVAGLKESCLDKTYSPLVVNISPLLRASLMH